MRCANPIPLKVVTKPARKDGSMIIVGLTEPATIIMLIIVVGINCNPADAKRIVIIIGNVIVSVF